MKDIHETGNTIRSGLLCLAIVVAMLLAMVRGEQWSRRAAGLPVGQERMWDAIATGDVKGLQQSLSEGANIRLPHPTRQEFPLEAAVSAGNPRIIKELLTHGADPNQTSWNELSPLLRAVLTGNKEAAELLLEAGVLVHDSSSRSALVMAIRLRSLKMVELLLASGGDIRHPDAKGITPLAEAMEIGDVQIIDRIRLAITVDDRLRASRAKFALQSEASRPHEFARDLDRQLTSR